MRKQTAVLLEPGKTKTE